MARKRYKKRISQKDKKLLQMLEEEAKKAEETQKSFKYVHIPGDSDEAYLKKLNVHQEYLSILHGHESKDGNSLTGHQSAKTRKNRRTHEKETEKKKKLKELKNEKLLEKSLWEDKVEFGEVVLRPPSNSKHPRKAVSKKVEFSKLNFMKQFTSVGNQFTSKKC